MATLHQSIYLALHDCQVEHRLIESRNQRAQEITRQRDNAVLCCTDLEVAARGDLVLADRRGWKRIEG